MTPATGYYTGTLTSNTIQGNTLLDPNNPAKGSFTFTAQPTAADTFTVGTITYKAVAALTGAVRPTRTAGTVNLSEAA